MKTIDEINLKDNVILCVAVVEFISRNKNARRSLLYAKVWLGITCIFAYRLFSDAFPFSCEAWQVWCAIIGASVITTLVVSQFASVHSPYKSKPEITNGVEDNERFNDEIIEFANVKGIEGHVPCGTWDTAKQIHYLLVEKRTINAATLCLVVVCVVLSLLYGITCK